MHPLLRKSAKQKHADGRMPPETAHQRPPEGSKGLYNIMLHLSTHTIYKCTAWRTSFHQVITTSLSTLYTLISQSSCGWNCCMKTQTVTRVQATPEHVVMAQIRPINFIHYSILEKCAYYSPQKCDIIIIKLRRRHKPAHLTQNIIMIAC